MARAGGPKSRVAFTFTDETLSGEETMATRTKRCGFDSFEGIAGDDLWRRYLPGEPHLVIGGCELAELDRRHVERFGRAGRLRHAALLRGRIGGCASCSP